MRKPGRPKTGTTVEKVNTSLPKELIRKIEELAERENRSKANMIMVLLQER